jgi:hypothetical protein
MHVTAGTFDQGPAWLSRHGADYQTQAAYMTVDS